MSPLDGGGGIHTQWQFWSDHKPYLVFSGMSLYFELCPIKIIFFLAGNEYLGEKNAISPLPGCGLEAARAEGLTEWPHKERYLRTTGREDQEP